MKITKNKKIIVIVAGLIILCSTGFFVFSALRDKSATAGTETANSLTTSEPATSNSASSTVEKTNDTSTVNLSSTVSMVIVDASKYNNVFEVRAYVSDVVENGVCTFTFTSGAKTVTKTSTATAGSSTSSCATMDIAISELSASNDWTLKLTYTSNSGNYSGETSKDIQI